MRKFSDAAGAKWELRITGGTIKRVSELMDGLDLGQPLVGDPPFLTRFDTEMIFKVDVLCAVLRPECKERDISDEAFAALLEGKVLYDASVAFWEELADFFQSLQRTEVVKAICRQMEIVKRGVEMLTDKLEGPAMDRAIEQKLTEVSERIDQELAEPGGSAASTPLSPDAIPSPEPSAS